MRARAAIFGAALALAVASGAAQTPPRGHAIAGAWRLNWVEAGRVTALEISAVAARANATAFSGALTAMSGESCPLKGEVIDETRARYTDGIVTTRFALQTYVTMTADCPGARLRFDLLGFTDGPILLSGRALAQTGPPLEAVVTLTRATP